MAETDRPRPGADTQEIERELLRIARMFAPYRENALMRDLCRLAVKCAQEGLVRDC